MNNQIKIFLDEISDNKLLAYRIAFINFLNNNQDLPPQVIYELRCALEYLEKKLESKGISFKTKISTQTLREVEGEFNSFASGITSSKYSSSNYEEKDFSDKIKEYIMGAALIGLAIYLATLGLSWLWENGIIQIILVCAGTIGGGIGIYKLYEHGKLDKLIDKIKCLFKKKVKNNTKKHTKAISKRHVETRDIDLDKQDDKMEETDRAIRFVDNLIVTTSIIVLLGMGYHLLDSKKFNGKKVALFNKTNENAVYSTYEFDKLRLAFKQTVVNDVLLIPSDGEFLYYDGAKLEELTYKDMNNVFNYLNYGFHNFDNPAFYNFNHSIFMDISVEESEVIKLFSDYRNEIIYRAQNFDMDSLKKAIESFTYDYLNFIVYDHEYSFSNVFYSKSAKFDDMNYYVKVMSISICKAIFSLDINYTNNRDFLSTWSYAKTDVNERSISMRGNKKLYFSK